MKNKKDMQKYVIMIRDGIKYHEDWQPCFTGTKEECDFYIKEIIEYYRYFCFVAKKHDLSSFDPYDIPELHDILDNWNSLFDPEIPFNLTEILIEEFVEENFIQKLFDMYPVWTINEYKEKIK